MNTVVVRIFRFGCDFQLVTSHIVAVVNPKTPTGGLIDNGEIFEFDVFATGEEKHSRRGWDVDSLIFPTGLLAVLRQGDEIVTVAIDFTHTRHRDVFGLFGE